MAKNDKIKSIEFEVNNENNKVQLGVFKDSETLSEYISINKRQQHMKQKKGKYSERETELSACYEAT